MIIVDVKVVLIGCLETSSILQINICIVTLVRSTRDKF